MLTPILVTFLHGGPVQMRESTYKSRVPAATPHLVIARGEHIFKKENISKVWEKSAAGNFAGQKQ